jgi:hypothetical protein
MKGLFHKASGLFTQSRNSDELHSSVQAQHTQGILNNNPPGDAPPSNPRTTDELTDIPKNILAFRTITTLLERIQQERKIKVSQPEKLPPPDRLELKISNAFSTIAVMEHEIVAIATKRTPEALKITACTQAPANEDSVIAPTQPGLPSQIWHLLVTQNYRWGDESDKIITERRIGKPTIDDAETLAGLELADDDALKRRVDEYW